MLIAGPDPTARDLAAAPAPDLEEGSLVEANLDPATAGPALPPKNPTPALVQQNASPVRRAVPRWSLSVILAADPRRTVENRSLAVVLRPQWKTGRKNGQPNLCLARPPNMRKTVQSPWTSDQPPAPSLVQGLVHGRDLLLRIRGSYEWSLFWYRRDQLGCFTGLVSLTSLLNLKEIWVL